MAKKRAFYRCAACGHEEPKWLGRCPECGEWNTLREEAPARTAVPDGSGRNLATLPLTAVDPKEGIRISAGTEEMNRVLGGGIMRGSSILVGGEPGIGKSTLMLQTASAMKTRVLYVTGEESAGQVRMRADRTGSVTEGIEILCGTEVNALLGAAEAVSPVAIVVDSLQTLYDPEIGSVPGTVNQMKVCTQRLTDWARTHSGAVFFIAHVTKEGIIAGPKVIEHMVDTVLYFDQTEGDMRILRSAKNRFGSVHEIGLFTMTAQGLRQIKDPSRLFLVARTESLPPGVAVVPVYEGSRVLLVEIQALTVPAKGGISRVFSDRIDSSRVSRIAAVLEKHLSLRFSDQDIYVNVAGGMRISETGVELPLAMALYSARTGIPLPPLSVLAGELTLAGEVRTISNLPLREKTAREMGFARFVGPDPGRDRDGWDTAGGKLSAPKHYEAISSIREGIDRVFRREGS